MREQDQYSFNGPTVLDQSHHYWNVADRQFPLLIVTTFMMLESHVQVQYISLCTSLGSNHTLALMLYLWCYVHEEQMHHSGRSRILKRGVPLCNWSLYLAKRNKARKAHPLRGGGWGHAPAGKFLISDLRSFLVPFWGEIARVRQPTAKSSHCVWSI